MPPTDIYDFLSRLVIIFVCFPVHEMAHAYAADSLGDDTPRINGRVTANPLVHIDLFGALILLLSGFGWAKPVPVSEYALQKRSRSGMMLVSLAGPGANLILAFIGAIVSTAFALDPYSGPGRFLTFFVFFNFVLFIFNLIPLFPLDGEKVALFFLPFNLKEKLYSLRKFGLGPLLLLVLFLPLIRIDILSWLVFNPAGALTSMLLSL